MATYWPLVWVGIFFLLSMLISGREWLRARKIYGSELWVAIKQTFVYWLLTRRYWMLYGSIILLCTAIGPLIKHCRPTSSNVSVIIAFALMALHTISWNSIPPGVLFLASSDQRYSRVRALVQKTTRRSGFRAVYLLSSHVFGMSMFQQLRNGLGIVVPSDAERMSFDLDNFRTSNGKIWKEIFHNLVALTPVIVMDTSLTSEGVSYELNHLLDSELYRKTLFIVDGEAPIDAPPSPAEQRMLEKLGPKANVKFVLPDEELDYAIRENLWRQTDITRVYGKPRHLGSTSAWHLHSKMTIKSTIGLVITACASIFAGLLAYSVLTAQVAVRPANPLSLPLQNVLLIEPGHDIEKARVVMGYDGGGLAGLSCVLGVSSLVGLWRGKS